MPSGAFPVTSSMPRSSGALPREDGRPYGTQDYWDTFVDGQSVDAAMIDSSSTPASSAPTPASPSCQTPPNLSQQRYTPDKLGFVEYDDWESMNSYEEDVPSCLHYRIVWKVVVNNKVISTDTEEDVVVNPVPYWHMVLRPKLDKLLLKKLPQNRLVRCDDTSVVLSVTARTEKDLVKRFDDLSIDWSVIAKTLMGWGEHFRSGKKLTVQLSFNYLDAKPPPAGSARRGNKRRVSHPDNARRSRCAARCRGRGHRKSPDVARSVRRFPLSRIAMRPWSTLLDRSRRQEALQTEDRSSQGTRFLQGAG
jgi:hypothetical protein